VIGLGTVKIVMEEIWSVQLGSVMYFSSYIEVLIGRPLLCKVCIEAIW